MTKSSLFLNTILTLLILLFAYAGVSKLLDYQTFSNQLGLSPLIPDKFQHALAFLLPLGEIGIAILLMTERFRLPGLYLSYFLMLSFTLYIYILLHHSTYIPCSCGGILGKMSWNMHILFNSLFTVLSLTGCYLCEQQQRRPSVAPAGNLSPA